MILTDFYNIILRYYPKKIRLKKEKNKILDKKLVLSYCSIVTDSLVSDTAPELLSIPCTSIPLSYSCMPSPS